MSFYQEDDTNQKCLYNVRADTQQFKTFFLHIFIEIIGNQTWYILKCTRGLEQ